MAKKKVNYKIGDTLNFEQVFDAELEILSQDDFYKRKNEIENRHKEFLEAEEWRKYIKWKEVKSDIIAVKLEDDKYKIRQIQHYTNKIEDIVHCQDNLDALFKYHPLLNSFRFDVYSKTKEYNGEKYDEDITPSLIFNFFRRNFNGWCPTSEIRDTITETIDNNKYNFVTDYFDSLVWDGIERLDNFLIDYYGAEDTPLVKAYFSRWIIALIKRSYEPGAKFDSMLILAGDPGKKKTTLFEWLGTINNKKLYNDAPDDLRNLSELIYASKGKVILMFDDFDDICDKGQIGKIKSFITQRSRTAALKWQHEKDYPITYVLCGSTNFIAILVDDSTFDERRFWIVEVNPSSNIFDIPDEIKEQLYAEAVYRYKQDPYQRLWIWEKELMEAEKEWQKKYKKASEDTQTEKIVNLFNKKYPIKDGVFENEDQFTKLTSFTDSCLVNDTEFFNETTSDTYNYISVIPAAWVIKYLGTSIRSTDRIIQILHTQGFNVTKLQRHWIYNKLLTCIKIINQPKLR